MDKRLTGIKIDIDKRPTDSLTDAGRREEENVVKEEVEIEYAEPDVDTKLTSINLETDECHTDAGIREEENAIKEEVEIEYEKPVICSINSGNADSTSIKLEPAETDCTSIDTAEYSSSPFDIDIDQPDIKRECLEATKMSTDTVKTASKTTLHSCTECDYVTRKRYNLKIHLLIHSNSKPYSCNQCNFTCRQSGILKRHASIHSDLKPFFCTQCEYVCRYKGALKRHALIHSNKPHSCRECDFTCREAVYLKTHALIHSNRKPYQCDICDYTCKQKRSLKRHLKLLHSLLPTRT